MAAKELEENRQGDSAKERRSSSRLGERAWTYVIIGVVLLAAGLSYTLRQPSRSLTASSQATQLSQALAPLATGEEPIGDLFSQAGCGVCHTIPGIPGAQGRVGPELLLGSTGPARLADPGYRGQARTVREYVVESILSPGVYVVSGYPDGVMPQWYGQKLSAGAVDKMVDYLERLTENTAVPKSSVSE